MAFSIHSADEETRSKLMPINRRVGLEQHLHGLGVAKLACHVDCSRATMWVAPFERLAELVACLSRGAAAREQFLQVARVAMVCGSVDE